MKEAAFDVLTAVTMKNYVSRADTVQSGESYISAPSSGRKLGKQPGTGQQT
jgi:hypothetical protein